MGLWRGDSLNGLNITRLAQNVGCIELMFERYEKEDWYCILKAELMDWQSDSDLVITYVAVPARHRRKGIAARMVEDVIAWAQSQSQSLTGEIRAAQVVESAIPFWEALGFSRELGVNPTNDYVRISNVQA